MKIMVHLNFFAVPLVTDQIDNECEVNNNKMVLNYYLNKKE